MTTRLPYLPYGRQSITDEDIEAVVAVLRSDWLTTGPAVNRFEAALADVAGAPHAVVFSSGTAALHAAVWAAGLQPGDEAITTPLTFCATANAVLYQGATPVFADIRADTLTIDPDAVRAHVTPRTRAILPVDYAGHPAELDAILDLAERHRLVVIEDAAHSLGATSRGRRVGSIAHMTTFSFHPVKHVATGEGGAVTTNDAALAQRLRRFRNHGIDADARQREQAGAWYYEMVDLGFNYRLTDIACALGASQLQRLDANLRRRRELAARYRTVLAGMGGDTLPSVAADVEHAWHLYPVRLPSRAVRDRVFSTLRGRGIGVNVHYIPVHLHPYYRAHLGTAPGLAPIAEAQADRLLSLPMFPGMGDGDVDRVASELRDALALA
jgi:perosamine synthetase